MHSARVPTAHNCSQHSSYVNDARSHEPEAFSIGVFYSMSSSEHEFQENQYSDSHTVLDGFLWLIFTFHY